MYVLLYNHKGRTRVYSKPVMSVKALPKLVVQSIKSHGTNFQICEITPVNKTQLEFDFTSRRKKDA